MLNELIGDSVEKQQIIEENGSPSSETDGLNPPQAKEPQTPSAKADLESEAAAVEDKKAEPQTVPLPVYMDLKHEVRDLRKQVLEQKSQPIITPAVEKAIETPPDPMEEYIKEYQEQYARENDGEKISASKVPLSLPVFRAHEDWKRQNEQIAQSQAAEQVRQQAMNVARVKYSDSVVGAGLGFDTIVSMAEPLLTEGDKLDIKKAGAGCAEVAYDRCIERLLRSNVGQDIQARINARQAQLQSQAVPAGAVKDTSTVEKETETPAKETEKVPSAAEAIGRDSHPHMAQLGFIQ